MGPRVAQIQNQLCFSCFSPSSSQKEGFTYAAASIKALCCHAVDLNLTSSPGDKLHVRAKPMVSVQRSQDNWETQLPPHSSKPLLEADVGFQRKKKNRAEMQWNNAQAFQTEGWQLGIWALRVSRCGLGRGSGWTADPPLAPVGQRGCRVRPLLG